MVIFEEPSRIVKCQRWDVWRRDSGIREREESVSFWQADTPENPFDFVRTLQLFKRDLERKLPVRVTVGEEEEQNVRLRYI